jgi:hypothetical protein
MRWSGSGNAYRFGAGTWQHGNGDTAGLAGWKKVYQSDEKGSAVVGDPVVCDPQMWRVQKESVGTAVAPGGKLPGADLQLVEHR